MEIVQLNLALSATADRIRQPKFKTVRRGYDPNQVLEYMSKVADRVQALEDRARELDSRLQETIGERDEALANKGSTPDSFTNVSSRVAELMTGLDEDVERIRGEANGDAERIVLDAKAEASRIQAQAEQMKADAEHALTRAQTEAEQATSGFRSRQESVRAELRSTCTHVLQMITDLEAAIGHEENEEPIVLGDSGDEVEVESVMEPTTLPNAPQ